MNRLESGRDRRTTDGFIAFEGPVTHYFASGFPKAKITGLHRDSLGWPVDQIAKYEYHANWATWTEQTFMNVEAQLAANYENVEKLWSSYKTKLDDFRAVAKNDMASLEAAARKTTEASHKLSDAYGHVITQLTGLEMQKAIENAERLATAMKAIAELQSHRLTFAVIDAKAGQD